MAANALPRLSKKFYHDGTKITKEFTQEECFKRPGAPCSLFFVTAFVIFVPSWLKVFLSAYAMRQKAPQIAQARCGHRSP
jgi:hypothetical protein